MKMNRPSTEGELEVALKRASSLARKGDYDEALEICDWLIESSDTLVAGYRQRAAVRELKGDIRGAIDDLRLVTSRAGDEPADFHALGLLELEAGDTGAAVSSFDKALEAGEKVGHAYYAKSSRLFRAIGRAKLNDFDGALEDCAVLPDEYGTHVIGEGMITVGQLRERIRRMRSAR